MSVFLSVALIIPITYIIIKYNLFVVKEEITTITRSERSMKIGLLGVMVIGVFIGVIGVLLAYWLKGLKTKFSIAKQIILGAVKLILPLCLVLLIVQLIYNKMCLIDYQKLINWFEAIKVSLQEIKDALLIIILCESIAIVINPLPRWCFDNNIDGLTGIAKQILQKE